MHGCVNSRANFGEGSRAMLNFYRMWRKRDERGSGQGLLPGKEGIRNQDAGENAVPVRKVWSNKCR